MERDHQSMYGSSEAAGDVSTALAVDEALNSGITFQSLLNVKQEITPSSLFDYPYRTSTMVDPVAYGYFVEDYPAIQNNQYGECSSMDGDQKLKSIDFMSDARFNMQRNELFNGFAINAGVSTEPFDFMSKTSDTISSQNVGDSSFRQLPDLRSLEQLHGDFSQADSSRKRAFPSENDSYAIGSILRNFQVLNRSVPYTSLPEARTPSASTVLTRQRRQRMSDKTRCLQKLLPWDHKMDMATMLDEACKYIKFLNAQISVLQSMPCDSPFLTRNPSNANLYRGLGRLNRQQLLQVLVNSPAVQTVMYSQGCCVYSVEQVVYLKNMAENQQQMLQSNPSML